MVSGIESAIGQGNTGSRAHSGESSLDVKTCLSILKVRIPFFMVIQKKNWIDLALPLAGVCDHSSLISNCCSIRTHHVLPRNNFFTVNSSGIRHPMDGGQPTRVVLNKNRGDSTSTRCEFSTSIYIRDTNIRSVLRSPSVEMCFRSMLSRTKHLQGRTGL